VKKLASGLIMLAALLLAPAAGAEIPARGVEVGRVAVSSPDGSGAALLVPVTYPIQMVGRVVRIEVALRDGSGVVADRRPRVRLSGGHMRRPERRRRFSFVHRFELGPALTRRLREGLRVRVAARAVLDANRDGHPELRSADTRVQALPRESSRGHLCSSLPRLRARPGAGVTVRLPACESSLRWHLAGRPARGRATIRNGVLRYRAPRRFRGTEALRLVARRGRGAAASSAQVTATLPITVGTAGGVVVRALGDSVTAGFGYYANGRPMTIGHLYECRPPEREFDDACSSNSLNVMSEEGEVVYAPDYGLSNDVSWAAQWANAHGITDYENLAISGSEPSDWAPEGEFHTTTERIESEDPDYLLMTVGANPLLSDMLFGLENMGCAIYADVFGGYRECIERAFAKAHLGEDLESLYRDLVQHTDATIYLMQYHLSVPSVAIFYSATQIAEMGKLLNREIATVAARVDPQRLQVVAPPHFDVGVDISPVYPSGYSCSRLGYEVDGPSVQSTATQTELEYLHPLSFCKGPVPAGPPWVISADTGIHPSAAGYAQMASRVPPPAG